MESLVYDRVKRRKHKKILEGCSLTAASKFMSTATDDLLLEIFLRLPDFRSVIECAFVCKRWFSLICRSKEYFRRTFNHFHRQKRLLLGPTQYSDPLSFTLIVKGLYWGYGSPPIIPSYLPPVPYEPRYDFYPERSKFLHYGQRQRGSIDFFPDYVHVWSSFEDLLLVQKDLKRYYVCNPFSRQRVALRKAPLFFKNAAFYRCGLVCEPYKCDTSSCTCYDIKYRVVKIVARTNNSDEQISDLLRLAIFSSETGKWHKSTLRCPVWLDEWHVTPVTNNGIIYWPFGHRKFQGVFALDPFKDVSEPEQERFCSIGMPLGFGRDWRCRDHRARLGAVRGQLRLSQFFWHKKSGSFVLKAWDLDAKTRSWDLAHHVRFEDAITAGPYFCLLLTALHPDDPDMFFFTRYHYDDRYRGESIELCQYQIGKENLETLCQFPDTVGVTNHSGLLVFPLLHPWWPTKIPKLPAK